MLVRSHSAGTAAVMRPMRRSQTGCWSSGGVCQTSDQPLTGPGTGQGGRAPLTARHFHRSKSLRRPAVGATDEAIALAVPIAEDGRGFPDCAAGQHGLAIRRALGEHVLPYGYRHAGESIGRGVYGDNCFSGTKGTAGAFGHRPGPYDPRTGARTSCPLWASTVDRCMTGVQSGQDVRAPGGRQGSNKLPFKGSHERGGDSLSLRFQPTVPGRGCPRAGKGSLTQPWMTRCRCRS